MAVAQSIGVFARQVEGWVFKSQPQQTKVVETGSDSCPLPNVFAIGIRCECPGDDHYRQMLHVTVGVAR